MYSLLLYLMVWVGVTLASMKNTSSVEHMNLPTPRIYGISTNKGAPTISWLLGEKSDTKLVTAYKMHVSFGEPNSSVRVIELLNGWTDYEDIFVCSRGLENALDSQLHLIDGAVVGMSNGSSDWDEIFYVYSNRFLDDIPTQLDSVDGAAVKLWQVGCDKKPKYKIVDGQQVRLKNAMPKLRDYSTLRNLTEYIVEGNGRDHGSLFLKDVEPDVPYHVTVAALAATHEGSPSDPFRFQYRGRYTCREI